MSQSRPPATIERLLFPIASLLVITLITVAPTLLSATTQLIGLAIVVALLGLPHGALDPWIAENIGLIRTPKQALFFNAAYLAIAALVILFWSFFPVTSLAIFLAISAWHFSGDWSRDMNKVSGFGAGLLLLLMPIGFHTDNVAMLFSHLSGDGGATLAQSLALPAWLLILAMLTLVALTAWRAQWLAALELLGLLALAYVAPPLVYFALYFCLLHSPRHLLGQFRHAGPTHQQRLRRMAATYTIATLVLLGALAWFWSNQVNPGSADTLILRLVFIGLAAVTVPHMMLIALAHIIDRSAAANKTLPFLDASS